MFLRRQKQDYFELTCKYKNKAMKIEGSVHCHAENEDLVNNIAVKCTLHFTCPIIIESFGGLGEDYIQ